MIVPLLLVPVGWVVVPVTLTVTPAQGSLGAGSPLEQLSVSSDVISRTNRYTDHFFETIVTGKKLFIIINLIIFQSVL
jgi:hypothetical protein